MFKLADGSVSTDYKIGDRFVVKTVGDPEGFSIGSVVEFYQDDRTEAPKFKLLSGFCGWNLCSGEAGCYQRWGCLDPIVNSVRKVTLAQLEKELGYKIYLISEGG